MRKSVMALLADKASDDGSGIYASKQTMADELCCSKQAILNTIDAFLAEGLLIAIGRRGNANGYTVEYGIVVSALEALPLVKCHADRAARQSTRSTGQSNRPVHENDRSTSQAAPVNHVDPNPSEPFSSEASPPSRKRARKSDDARYHRLPADWKPVRFADDTVAREIVDRRGRDWARAALESFRLWAANADDRRGIGRKVDWQAAWAGWIIRQDKQDGNRNEIRRDNRSVAATGDGFTAALRAARDRQTDLRRPVQRPAPVGGELPALTSRFGNGG
jgi:biotin operon repressor